MNFSQSPPSYFREISLRLFADLMELLIAGRHLSLIAPRQSGKAVVLHELKRQAQQLDEADRPRIVLLRSLHFHGLEENEFLARLAGELAVPLGTWDEQDEFPLAAKVGELIRAAAGRSTQPLWLFVQNITEYPWPSGRAILEALQDISLDPHLRKVSVVVSGSQEFVSLTYHANSPYRHATKFFLTGFDRELTHRFYRARAGGISLNEGFDEAALQHCPTLTAETLDYLYTQTAGYAKFIEELIFTVKRPSPAVPQAEVAELNSPATIERLIAKFISEHLEFEPYCKMSLRDVQRNADAWEKLQHIVDGGAQSVLLGTTQPHLLETSGIVRRDERGYARIASPMWQRYLSHRLTRRYRGDIYALLGDWPNAWKCFEATRASICDRALDGEERYLLNRVIKSWEDSLLDATTHGSEHVAHCFLQGARHLLGCDTGGLFDWGTGRLLRGYPPDQEAEDIDQTTFHALTDNEIETRLYDGRLALASFPHRSPALERIALFPYVRLTRAGNREFDSSTLDIVRRSLRRFWQAYLAAKQAEYEATMGTLRERHLRVVATVNELLTVNPGDMQHVVQGAVDALIDQGGYYRILICLVSPKGDRIQAVAGRCVEPQFGFDFRTDYPLDPYSDRSTWDIQQWVAILGTMASVPDASSPTQVCPRTQSEHVVRIRMKAICVVPIKLRRRGNHDVEVLGTIHLERHDKRPLSDDEISSCEILANQLAVTFDQARRLSMLEQSLRVLDEDFRVVSPAGRVVFRNHPGSDPQAEPAGWSFPISTVNRRTVPPRLEPDVVADAAQLGQGVHRYVKEVRHRRSESGQTLKAWDEFAAPIEDFRQRLPAVFAADGTVGYVHLTHSIADLVQMHEALHDWLGASSPRDTADRILRYFQLQDFSWCRIYLRKNPASPAECHLESFAQFGIKDKEVAQRFRHGEYRIQGGEHGQQAVFLMDRHRRLAVFRYDPRVEGDPVLDENLGRGLPVYRTRDNWREEFGKTDQLWIEAPLIVGDEVVGLIALSLPRARGDRQMPSPEFYEKLRWCVVSVAVALYGAIQGELRVARQREETARAASELAIHQLSNKLSASESLTHLANRWLTTRQDIDPVVRERVSRLLDSSLNGMRSSRAILQDFRRYASNQPFTDIRNLRVADLLRDVCRHLRGIHPDVEVDLVEPSAQLWIRASESGLREVFEILFHNSVTHSRKDPLNLRVSLRASPILVTSAGETDLPKACRLLYEDNGVGIPAENCEQIFEPFYTTHEQGNGLGLAIARRFVARQDGSITAEKHAGMGATFAICLPSVEVALLRSPAT